ncbi:MAG: RsmB/NOP family class I SAM-dependent RNA methyltransferase [Verrucomicrobia bacterium]|nr:RsmB/NOP family class I SAM-dependent RNA methyltransferase [Verrucomicrobiota bacterium]
MADRDSSAYHAARREYVDEFLAYHSHISRALTEERTSLESKLIPVSAYIIVSCIEALLRYPDLLRRIDEAMPADEIGRRARRPGCRVNTVHLWSIANLPLVGRKVLELVDPVRANDVSDLATIADFWERATRAYRAALAGDWPACPPTVAAKAAHLGASTDTLLPAWMTRHCPESAVSPNLDTLHTRAPLWLRLQTTDVARIVGEFNAKQWPTRRSAVLPGALEVLAEADVTKSDAWTNGLFEVQDLGSQLILESAGIAPGGRWLDACAGAGGKTLQLAALLGPQGHVDAHDIRTSALRELEIRATRAHATTISVLPTLPATAAYDGVLVDAPCSGTGTWRRSPHLKWTTSAGQVTAAAEKQLALLTQFSALVRPGGRLVYATCSLSRLENEDVVTAFLAAQPGFTAEPPAKPFGETPRSVGLAILPATHNTDGFYVASLRRS